MILSSKKISVVLRLIDHAVQYGLLEKSDVIEWADKIILKEKEPHIFFIELSLLGKREIMEVAHYLNELETDVVVPAKPLLALLLNKFSNGKLLLPKTLSMLYMIKGYEGVSQKEEDYIYRLDADYDYAIEINSSTALLDVEKKNRSFLKIIQKLYT